MTFTHDHVIYPRELAGRLLPVLAERRERSLAGSHGGTTPSTMAAPLPSEEVLARMLDVAYATSLYNEEGRACLLTIGYVSCDSAAALGKGTFNFSSPLPFDPAHLRKLAPATDPVVTCVAVWPIKDNDNDKDNGNREEALGAWGLLHQGDVKFSIDRDRELRPHFLQIRVIRPGAFNVYYGGQTVALFVTDHFHIFESRLDLIGMLRGPLTDGTRAREFVRLATRMLALGHGGTILIVDKRRAISGLIPHLAFSHPNGPASVLKDAFENHEHFTTLTRSGALTARIADEPELQFLRRRRDAERAHADVLDFVAQLTAVDGALVMQDDLSIVGFGATIQMGTAQDPRIVLEDPRAPGTEAEVLVSSIGGNRHRSAVLFCMQQEGLALALVASQDGDLSLVGRKDDGRAHVIRPFELGEGL